MSDEINKIEYEEIDINLIDKMDDNPNEMSQKQFDRLTEDIENDGFTSPIEVWKSPETERYIVLGGHHRLEAVRILGWEKIPAIIQKNKKFKDADYRKMVNVKLNVLKGKLSPQKFVKMLDGMKDQYSDEVLADMMGFAEVDAFKKLKGDVSRALNDSGLDPKIKDKIKKSVDESKTIDNISNILNTLFAKYGNTLDQNFMILSYGGKDHLFISMEKKMYKNVEDIREYCIENKVDINLVMNKIFKSFNFEDLKKEL